MDGWSLEDLQNLRHAPVLVDDAHLVILLNLLGSLDLDLPQLDHLELVHFVLRLVDQSGHVGFADFSICILFVDLVLILRVV